MKKLICFISLIILSISFTSCIAVPLEEPKHNLEFWIGENVDNFNFSTYQKKYGIMGGVEYYGTDYVPTYDEYNEQIDPKYCVIYTITSYPDYSSKAKHITGIYITDPSIELYGLSLNSSKEEVKSTFEKMGFSIEELGDKVIKATKNRYIFSFANTEIRIRFDVSNKQGIVF